MDVSGEAADVVVRESMAIATEGVKLAGAAVKNVAAFLLALANSHPQEAKAIIGKTTAQELAKDPAPAVVTPLKKEDLQKFQKLAMKYGLPYFIVKPKGKDGPFDVVSTESHACLLYTSQEGRAAAGLSAIEVPAQIMLWVLGCPHHRVVHSGVGDGEPAHTVRIFGLQGSQVMAGRDVGVTHCQGDGGGFSLCCI